MSDKFTPTAPPHIAARFRAPGPKRILALDGGGTRGIVSLCFLAEIEATLRQRFNKPDLVLSDYFDLIGGTSVGSMIATLFALGKPVAYIRERFEKWAPRIFEAKAHGYLSHMFDARSLRNFIEYEIRDTTLGSPDLKTGLCIVTKRIDTGSVWPVINNPFDQYYYPRPGIGNGPRARATASTNSPTLSARRPPRHATSHRRKSASSTATPTKPTVLPAPSSTAPSHHTTTPRSCCS